MSNINVNSIGFSRLIIIFKDRPDRNAPIQSKEKTKINDLTIVISRYSINLHINASDAHAKIKMCLVLRLKNKTKENTIENFNSYNIVQ